MNSLFENAFSEIRASESLKSETLKRMLMEEQQGSGSLGRTKAGYRKWQRIAFPAAAVLVCAVLAAVALPRKSAVPYVTLMEDGVYYDQVVLEDGEIHFVANRVAISITPNAGELVIGGQGLEETAEKQEADIESILTESGGTLSYGKTGAVSLPPISDENWSYIGEQRIYVTVLKTEEVRYQAVYESEGTAYEVIGVNVTQKEFIDFLYEKIK